MKTVFPPRPADTTADADRVQTALLRQAPVARRLGIGFSLSASVMAMARAALVRAHPTATDREIDLRFVEIHHGRELADALGDEFVRRAREHPPAT